jgi:hypothetical protein
MERVRSGSSPIRPVLISDYLRGHSAKSDVRVQTGAWNVAQTSGRDFSQWAGTDTQKRAIAEVFRLSARCRELSAGAMTKPVRDDLADARHLLLESETSCYLFWGDAWVPRLLERTSRVAEILDRVESAQRRAHSLP